MKNRFCLLVKSGFASIAIWALVAGAGFADFVYIGDYGDNSVKKFDAATGAYLGEFVSASSPTSTPAGLNSINGLIFDKNHNLLLVNQNANTQYSGEVLRYSGNTGTYLGPLVSGMSTNAPWAPRGIVIGKDGDLYVADEGQVSGPPPGYIDRYNATTGAFISQWTAPGLPVTFQPRAMVFGPDGLLYVTNYEDYPSLGTGQAGLGSILRFNPATGAYLGQFVNRNGSSGGPPLMSPEGLTFGPNGDLYTMSLGNSFSQSQDEYIIRYNGKTGAYVSSIDIGTANLYRLAAALLFGPDGKLYVPMSQTGEVRRYDVNTGTYSDFIAAGGPLVNPWFLTFGQTNPTTLAYVPASWAHPVSGSWTDASKWSTNPSIPEGAGQPAVLSGSVSSALTVTLDGPQTLGSLELGNTAHSAFGYTLSAGSNGSLTMDNDGSSAVINVSGGSQAISAPMTMASNLIVTPSSGATLNISGNISQTGTSSLTLLGPGMLILSGSNTYSGGTNVDAGTLVVTSGTALPDGTSLTVGAGGTFIFDPSMAGSPVVGSAATSSVAAVPEPGTPVLLATGVLVAFAAWRRRRR